MTEHERTLGIDYGNVRVGLSLSDPLGIIATPYKTLRNDGQLFEQLKDIVRRENVSLLVLGMPISLRGKKDVKAQEVDAFADRLKTEIGLPVIFLDERFSTRIAQKTLLGMNTKKKDRNAKDGTLDAMAAAIILQDYLDSRKNSLIC